MGPKNFDLEVDAAKRKIKALVNHNEKKEKCKRQLQHLISAWAKPSMSSTPPH